MSFAQSLHDTFLDDVDEGRICRDIPDEACDEQPRAFSCQLIAQTLTKLGDAIVSPRLVLAWMLSVAGSPAVFIALLVPARESFSLLPQLFIAKYLRERPVRKTFWVVGAIGQALSLAAMIPAVLLTEGVTTGALVVLFLVIFSLCRGINSITSKDVMGKTISKSRRGRLTGLAASTAGVATLVAAGILITMDQINAGQTIAVFIALLATAVGLWLIAAAVYSQVPEVPGATEGGGSAFQEALKSLTLLATDSTLRQFVIVRSLLVSAGISIPYIVFLVQQQEDSGFGDLGTLMVAEGLAAMTSGYLWGKWSDVASHRVMAVAAGLCATLLMAVVGIALFSSFVLGNALVAGALLFTAAFAHQGIRIARKTYLVDAASSDNRAQYTAVSNTVIGLIVASTGLFGIVDAYYGTVVVLALLAAIAFTGAVLALRLPDANNS